MKYRDLYQQRQMIWGAMRNLMLQAETSNRPMTKMQIAAFDQLHTDLDYIDRQLWNLKSAAPARTTAYHGGGLIAPGTITAAPITSGTITITTFDGERVTLSTEPEACSCGYRSECAVWCGDGHETGTCTDHSHRFPAKAYKADDYERYKELYATTGDEKAFTKMLDCVTME